jgi:DNA repair exonuclease SbcCD ATPase subunit
MSDVAEKQEVELEEVEVIEAEPELEAEEPKAEAEPQEEAEAEAPRNDNEDELAQYSESVQRRIRTLTGKYREEERQRQAAVEYAEAVKKQNEDLKSRLDNLDKSYQGEFGSRVESQIESAKQAYQKAYDDGDAEAMFEAQKNLSKLALDQARLEESKSKREAAAETVAAQPQQPQRQPQPQQQAAPDPKAESWATKNEWFGQDQTMTYAAFGLHRQLIEDEGFDPSSDEYYNELDRRIRTEFPHKFKEKVRDTGPRVASAESTASKSSSPKKRRTVKLTPSQIAIAKRLNVPLEEYAKYVKE